MRLGILLDRWRPGAGGLEAHTDLLARRATAAGEEVVLALVEGEGPPGTRTLAVAAPRRRPARERALAEDGERLLREAGCDVVLALRHALRCDVYLPHGGLVEDALLARDLARGTGRLRRAARALGSSRLRFFLEAEEALLGHEEGPVVICVSRALATRVGARYPRARRRLRVIPNGVDLARHDPAPLAAAGRAVRREQALEGAYVGLLLAHDPVLKGLATAIDALARPEVTGLVPPFHLVAAGGRPPRALLRRARRLGVSARLRVVGPVEDPRPWLAAADVLVHPTWHDPCSLACLEALAQEVPVITTPLNGVRELMGMRGGIVVEEAGSPGAIAVAVRVLADPALRRLTAEDARQVARKSPLGQRLDEVLDVCRGVRRSR